MAEYRYDDPSTWKHYDPVQIHDYPATDMRGMPLSGPERTIATLDKVAELERQPTSAARDAELSVLLSPWAAHVPHRNPLREATATPPPTRATQPPPSGSDSSWEASMRRVGGGEAPGAAAAAPGAPPLPATRPERPAQTAARATPQALDASWEASILRACGELRRPPAEASRAAPSRLARAEARG